MGDRGTTNSPGWVTKRLSRALDWWDQLTWSQLLLLCAAGAVLVGAYVYLLVPRRYTAMASILLSEQPDVATSLGLALAASGSASSGGALSALGLGGGGGQLQRLEEILRSRRLRDQLLAKHHLRERLGLESEDKALEWIDRATKIQEMGKGPIPGVGGGVGLRIAVILPSSGRVLQWGGKPSPFSTQEAQELCAQLANDYVALLDQYVAESNVQSARDDRVFIENRKREAETRLRKTEDQLQALQTRYEVMEPSLKVQQLLSVSQNTIQAYATAEADLAAINRSLQAARSALTRQQALRVSEEVTVRNPVLQALEEKITQLRMDLATELASGKSAQHPDTAALRAAIASAEHQEAEVKREIRASLTTAADPAHDATVQKVVDLEVNLAAARARHTKYGRMLARLEKDLNSLPPVARAYARLARQRDMEADLVAALAKRLEMAMIQEQMESAERFQVLDVAVPPVEKSGPSTVRSTVGSFLLFALLLGIASAYRRGLFVVED